MPRKKLTKNAKTIKVENKPNKKIIGTKRRFYKLTMNTQREERFERLKILFQKTTISGLIDFLCDIAERFPENFKEIPQRELEDVSLEEMTLKVKEYNQEQKEFTEQRFEKSDYRLSMLEEKIEFVIDLFSESNEKIKKIVQEKRKSDSFFKEEDM